MKPLLALALAVALPLVAPRLAAACSPLPCWPGSFLPGDGAHVPANLPGLIWRPMRPLDGAGTADPSQVVLATTADPATPIPFTATALTGGDYLLVPQGPLVAGTSYVLVDHTTCEATGAHGPSVTFTATATAPEPAELGALAASDDGIGSLTLGTVSGSCSSDVSADRATITLAPSADAAPWLDVIEFETRVDGHEWGSSDNLDEVDPPGQSWQGRGRDLLYEVCETMDDGVSAGLAAGTHQVELRATLPGSQAEIASAPIDVTLACAPEQPPTCATDPTLCPVDPAGPAHDGCSAADPSGAAWLVLALGVLLLPLRRRMVNPM